MSPSRIFWFGLAIPIGMALAIGLAVFVGDGLLRESPAQLQSVMTMNGLAIHADDRNALREDVLQYLGVDGLPREQVKVDFDERLGRNVFRIVGDHSLPAELLRAVAQRLEAYSEDRNWFARLEILRDEFPVRTLRTAAGSSIDLQLDWGRASVTAESEVFVEALQHVDWQTPIRPRTFMKCLLSFTARSEIPRLEYSFDALVGGEALSGVHRQMNTALSQWRATVPHRLTYTAPVLEARFHNQVSVADGELQFVFDRFETPGVVLDRDRVVHAPESLPVSECATRLKNAYPELAVLVSRRGLFHRVEAFGPAYIRTVRAP